MMAVLPSWYSFMAGSITWPAELMNWAGSYGIGGPKTARDARRISEAIRRIYPQARAGPGSALDL